jgi:L-lactate dehydrogenase complex protein LldG
VAEPVSAARDAILARVRGATAGTQAAPPLPRGYLRQGTLDHPARLARLADRIDDYRAAVRHATAASLSAAIGETLAARGARRIGIPSGLADAWRPQGLELVDDTGLSPAELAQLDAVVTGCTVAIAETGTLILSGGPSEGRRALTLVPDLHLCIVGEDQVVETVPEAIEMLAPLVRLERRPITLISGPSATSDIELSRVEGVHGPRTLVVFILSKEP